MISLWMGPNLGDQKKEFVSIKEYHGEWITKDTFEMTIEFSIADGIHIQSNKPYDENFIATKMIFKNTSNMHVEKVHFPVPVSYDEDNYGENYKVYIDQFEVVVRFKVNHFIESTIEPTIIGELYYQACQKGKCFYPKSMGFSIEPYRYLKP